MLRIGVDTGGTFTDFILVRDGALVTLKVPSTPKQPEQAVLLGVQELLGEADTAVELVHGTTVGTNALLERKGARTALLTTEGFEDVLEIGRQNRPGLYQLTASRPKPLVPRSLRFGVRERVTSSGEVLIPLDRERVRELRARLAEEGVESIAVCYLFAFLEPKHERETAELLTELGVPISLSHEILPEFREYERTSTTVINAYLAPLMSRYISRLEEGVAELGKARSTRRFALRIMQSNGGSISARAAAQQPVRTVLSGPAGGVVGAFAVAQLAGFSRIITFDMGGTSTDVSLVEGAIQTTHEARIAELPIGIPVIDIHTVGAGGGSIARVDEGGALRVGPESAGADPGPVCYGRGEELTVTDAHLLLGRLDPDRFLGGAMPLHLARTVEYFQAFRQRFPRPASEIEIALGILDVANANMARAIKVISIERGYDPRDFVLVAFGGAGGLHACDLAEMLSIPRVLVPPHPGLLSALGVLLSDVLKDYSQTVMLSQGEIEPERLEAMFARLEERARADLQAEGFPPDRILLSRFVDVRYAGQAFELSLPFTREFIADFHRAHERRYGYADPMRRIELVTVRVRGCGITEKPACRPKARDPRPIEPVARRSVHFREGNALIARETPFYWREALTPGATIFGPAIILEYSATTVIPLGWRADVDEYENLILSREG
ncbi:MAG: hydantoinase/oxoprolinase family protein [Blastocatellia bacterium]|nr:hydantoinase/oxoprolinase family protein [Blastocatellia bacterium]MCS7158364.1 hydantoinase/oxoprolinase family protein [Blastocatellia bacterium]MCX7752870.1 hydantoinase/oxoprolinase family protein [Blastocatellia bacterium]MDW8167926.1 hydantoinase/oxoprolinase family protein [Acidobacteriota bacterium]MDW8255951.1 hydantoinase/oxoprolinase family protein [Acidobacteriota bacterium]